VSNDDHPTGEQRMLSGTADAQRALAGTALEKENGREIAMKHRYLLGLAFATCAFLVSLASLHPAQAQSSGPVRGQVMDVDQSTGEITIRHGPIKKLGMDHGMTMVFHAQDAMLKRVKAGDRVKFEAQDLNGEYSVTRIEKVK
jgi:Cu(I)/Ag(I) efflux system protein CusF